MALTPEEQTLLRRLQEKEVEAERIRKAELAFFGPDNDSSEIDIKKAEMDFFGDTPSVTTPDGATVDSVELSKQTPQGGAKVDVEVNPLANMPLSPQIPGIIPTGQEQVPIQENFQMPQEQLVPQDMPDVPVQEFAPQEIPMQEDFPPMTQEVFGQEVQDVEGKGDLGLGDEVVRELILSSPDSFNRMTSDIHDFLNMSNSELNEAVEGSVLGAKELFLSLATNSLGSIGIDVSSNDPKVKASREFMAEKIGEAMNTVVEDPGEVVRMAARNPFQIAQVVAETMIAPGNLAGVTKKLGDASKLGKVTADLIDKADVGKIVFGTTGKAKKNLLDPVLDKAYKFGADTALRRVTKGNRDKFKAVSGGESMGEWVIGKTGGGTLDGIAKKMFEIKNKSLEAAKMSLEGVPGIKSAVTKSELDVIINHLKDQSKRTGLPSEFKERLNKFKDIMEKNEMFSEELSGALGKKKRNAEKALFNMNKSREKIQDQIVAAQQATGGLPLRPGDVKKIDSLREKLRKISVENMPKVRRTLDEINSKVKKNESFKNNPPPTASEMHEVQRVFSDITSAYNAMPLQVKDSNAAEAMAFVRDKMKTQLEDLAAKNGVSNFKDINRETMKASLTLESLGVAQDPVFSGVDASLVGFNPQAVLAKKALETTILPSTIASIFDKLSGTERAMLQSDALVGHYSPKSKSIINKMRKELKNSFKEMGDTRGLQDLLITTNIVSPIDEEVDKLKQEFSRNRVGKFTPGPIPEEPKKSLRDVWQN